MAVDSVDMPGPVELETSGYSSKGLVQGYSFKNKGWLSSDVTVNKLQ
jgi:hypothetical protein